MKKFWKRFLLVIQCIWYLLFCYFAWVIRYSSHPERYPLEIRYAKTRKLVLFILKHTRMDLAVENKPEFDTKESKFFCANHVSALDPLLLVAMSKKPIRFIAKIETRIIPVAGRILRAMDALFLDRDDPRQAIRIFQDAYRSIDSGEAHICIFPEGTRNRDPYHQEVAPFHPGSFKIATKKKMSVTPIVLFGTTDLLGTNQFSHLEYVQVSFLDTLDSAYVSSKRTVELSEEIHALVSPRFIQLREENEAYYAKKKYAKKKCRWWEEMPQ